MLKREIKYTDFDGNETADTYYFNITKSEIIELEVGHEGGLEQFIKRVSESKDNQALVAEFKKLILTAYGQKSPDGKRFIKSTELKEEFSQTAAFDELFIELATDADKAAEFIIGVIPADLRGKVEENDKTNLPPPNIKPAEELRAMGVYKDSPIETTSSD